jgi:hypothetical protein
MERNEAQEQLAALNKAQRASGRPPLPLAVTIASSLALGVGVALLGHGPSGFWTLALAAVLLAVAYLLPARYRNRKGLFGYRGRVHRTNVVWALVLVTLFVCGLNADSTLAAIYVGLGVVAAATYFFALRGWGMPK